jgi:hypothetical protein
VWPLRGSDVTLAESPRQDLGGTDRLLPGEVRDSTALHDAVHWTAVYQELLNFLKLANLDVPTTVERFERRLAHWRRRWDELRGFDVELTERSMDRGGPGRVSGTRPATATLRQPRRPRPAALDHEPGDQHGRMSVGQQQGDIDGRME